MCGLPLVEVLDVHSFFSEPFQFIVPRVKCLEAVACLCHVFVLIIHDYAVTALEVLSLYVDRIIVAPSCFRGRWLFDGRLSAR